MPIIIKKMIAEFWSILKSPADDCGLYPISTRIGIYGLILTGILYAQCVRFDSTELLSVLTFVIFITFIESIWKKVEAGKRILWHFVSLIILVCFLGVLLDQSIKVREAYYRTHVLESKIEKLVGEAPTPIIIANGLNEIKFINKQAEDVIGWKNEEIKGKSLSILMRPEKFPLHEAAFNKEVEKLKNDSISWIYPGNQIFRILDKFGSIIKVRIYLLGVRYSPEDEPGIYPSGQDVEFYAIIEPILPLIDPEEAMEKAESAQKSSDEEDVRDQKSLNIPGPKDK